jgi:hypothetical protein
VLSGLWRTEARAGAVPKVHLSGPKANRWRNIANSPSTVESTFTSVIRGAGGKEALTKTPTDYRANIFPKALIYQSIAKMT